MLSWCTPSEKAEHPFLLLLGYRMLPMSVAPYRGTPKSPMAASSFPAMAACE